jgi:hypothetical protein
MISWLYGAWGRISQASPYLAIELIAPGGSVIALLLWLYRRVRKSRSRDWVTVSRLQP